MRRIGQTFSDVYNYMRRHQLKFGYGPKYPSLEVVVKPVETSAPPKTYYKPLKTGTDTKTYLNKLKVGDSTLNKYKTSALKVKQLTPHHNENTKLVVDDSAPNPKVVAELTPIQIEVGDTTMKVPIGTLGSELPPPPGSLIFRDDAIQR